MRALGQLSRVVLYAADEHSLYTAYLGDVQEGNTHSRWNMVYWLCFFNRF